GTIVRGAYALGRLLLARRDRRDLGVDIAVGRVDRLALRERIEQKLCADLSLRSRTQLLAHPRERLLPVRARRRTEIDAGEQRLRPTLDERRRHVERVARDDLIEDRVAHRIVGTTLGFTLEVGPDPSAQIGERLAAAVIAREVIVERRQLLRAELLHRDLE